MPTFQSSARHHRPKRSRWDHCNTPDARRRRRAKADARREAMAATLPPVDPGPVPLSAWQTVLVLDSHGEVMHSIRLYVPTHGRCDQHAAEIDGQRCGKMLTATDIGRRVAGMICKRPSVAMQAELRAWRIDTRARARHITEGAETMTDRELLEKAAKAAGVAGEWCEFHGMDVGQDAYGIGNPRVHRWGDKLWNPLVDDGDALRLLAALPTVWTQRLMFGDVVSLSAAWGTGAGIEVTQAAHDFGRAWALRRAIVRAAAAMTDRPASAA